MTALLNFPNIAAWRLVATALVCLMLTCTGCVERTLTIKTDPPGALVFLNNDEIGRSPARRDFTHYGTYDVVIRKEGYETLREPTMVGAPIWQWFPIDLIFDILPFRFADRPERSYELKPVEQPSGTAALLFRAEQQRQLLQDPPK